MCRTLEEGGRRCNKHNAYGKQLTNLQARKQYTIRRLANPEQLTEKQHKKLLKQLNSQTHSLDILKTTKETLGKGLIPYTMNLTPECEQILDVLETAGYRPYLVGGSVRDELLGSQSKDIDIEVYGGTANQVVRALRKLGKVDEVGKNFGVLKITLGDEDFDISLPRRDSKTGEKHTDFDVEVDPEMSLDEATSRRDYTVNALMYNHKLGFIIDKHGGLKDLKNKQLKHVSDAYDEDPLRVLRGVQMASRFGFTLHPETILRARTLKNQYSKLALERVQVEFQKLWEKGNHPDYAFQLLKETEWDTNFPGLEEVNTPELWGQLKTVQTKFKERNFTGGEQLPHLLGAVIAKKISTTNRRNFLKHVMLGDTHKNASYNLASIGLPEQATDRNLRHLAYDAPRFVNLNQLTFLEGITGNSKHASEVHRKAERLGVLNKPEEDMVTGHTLLELFPDRKTGKWVGELLRTARDAQYSDVFRTPAAGKRWVQQNYQ